MFSCGQIDITEVKFHLPHCQIHLVKGIHSTTRQKSSSHPMSEKLKGKKNKSLKYEFSTADLFALN